MKAAKAHKKTTSSGQVRIISGRWRGRKIPVADAEGLRPTTDRVRETLFNWLMQETDGNRVLDCFAGSGALAFEAMSRGAVHATLLEQDRKLTTELQRLCQQLGASADVIQTDTLQHLRTPPALPYQLVFIDPPFRQGLAEPCCQLLEQHHWLTDDALIYLETEKELALTTLPANWQLRKEKIAGQLAYRLFQRTPNV
ncbi:16S rRNA (guanine(966)-N(2))-methyltransferase RsmD [Alkalimonas collagenimarina]|uniref:Ribosomal RNA small subunit methyltransferase D n=1 Tax=Alkalimonas collagenimarina TaxID=400390 RepID=A0ABT9GWL4_9GAMM|nr:16S rRNA (guanine(966)-N(2))-methyltransferase RsmD [Alkalimonas collagenimarina]MDP4535075.1 16S rRNA (guanine(966)-N(2))-methyltransferase RsmD [Alkalimonas collagenimarina]